MIESTTLRSYRDDHALVVPAFDRAATILKAPSALLAITQNNDLDTARSPSLEMVNSACAEIVRRYRAAGYSWEAAQEQAELFTRHFVIVGDHTPERATFPIDPSLDSTLAEISEAMA